jgi:hypothetical protein
LIGDIALPVAMTGDVDSGCKKSQYGRVKLSMSCKLAVEACVVPAFGLEGDLFFLALKPNILSPIRNNSFLTSSNL